MTERRPTLLCLPDECLMAVLELLPVTDLAATGCTCHSLARVVRSPALAEGLCRRRWAVPNARAFCRHHSPCACDSYSPSPSASEPGGTGTASVCAPPVHSRSSSEQAPDHKTANVDWRKLYSESNGWRQPTFKTDTLQPRAEFITSIAFSRNPSFRGITASPLLVASSAGVDVWAPGKDGQQSRIAQFRMEGVSESETIYAVRQANEDTLVAGSSSGCLLVFRDEERPAVQKGPSDDAASSVVDLQVLDRKSVV